MHDIAGDVLPWFDDGRTFAVCIVVEAWSSAPRPVGSMLAVDTADHVLGGLSGGCVEADVIARAQTAMVSGTVERAHYGVDDGTAMSVGLPCGGHIDVLIVPVTAERREPLQRAFRACEADASVALAVVTDTVAGDTEAVTLGGLLCLTADDRSGGLGLPRLDEAVTDDARGQLALGRTTTLRYGPHGERLGEGLEVLVISRAPRPTLVIFGAIDHARALSRAARFVGHHVTVCDARALFATRARFPEADEVVVAWPHRHLAELLAAGRVDARTVLIDLTHDLKFDVPLLLTALDPACPAGFVGAMGSRRTNEKRRERLLAEGMPADWWTRLHTPVGLDLGARTPEETALSIMAEVIADRWGATGMPLNTLTGPIHRPEPS